MVKLRAERKKESIVNELLHRFVSGRYCCGEKIVVKTICEETGVSRFPVMAALNDLRVAGFVIITAQVGCEVISPTPAEVHDFFLFFGRMEGMLAELAAERRLPAEIGGLWRINDQIKKIRASRESAEEYRGLNRELHRRIHALARSPTLHERQVANWAMADFLISQAGGFVVRQRQAASEHDAVIDAIEKQATARARMAMEEHIMTFGTSVVALSKRAFTRVRDAGSATVPPVGRPGTSNARTVAEEG
jgi:DNA-binding GntR family transcriptional regulator